MPQARNWSRTEYYRDSEDLNFYTGHNNSQGILGRLHTSFSVRQEREKTHLVLGKTRAVSQKKKNLE